jgi:hypothetical protein
VDTGRSHAHDMAPVPAMEMPILDFMAQPLLGSSLPCGYRGANPRGGIKSCVGDYVEPYDEKGLAHREEHGGTVA